MTAINIEITGKDHEISTRKNAYSGVEYLDIVTDTAVITLGFQTARQIASAVASAITGATP